MIRAHEREAVERLIACDDILVFVVWEFNRELELSSWIAKGKPVVIAW